MGFYANPWNRYGTLQDEQMRAMRLVVDTGIHAKGWSREQAIDFMLANSGMTRTEVVAEVERYIAIPSQALAYKIGALTIQRSEEHTSELQSLMRNSYAVFCLKKKTHEYLTCHAVSHKYEQIAHKIP